MSNHNKWIQIKYQTFLILNPMSSLLLNISLTLPPLQASLPPAVFSWGPSLKTILPPPPLLMVPGPSPSLFLGLPLFHSSLPIHSMSQNFTFYSQTDYQDIFLKITIFLLRGKFLQLPQPAELRLLWFQQQLFYFFSLYILRMFLISEKNHQ